MLLGRIRYNRIMENIIHRNQVSSLLDIIGKLVKFQRGPATVIGSKLRMPLYESMGRCSFTMTISQDTSLIPLHQTYEDRQGCGLFMQSCFYA